MIMDSLSIEDSSLEILQYQQSDLVLLTMSFVVKVPIQIPGYSIHCKHFVQKGSYIKCLRSAKLRTGPTELSQT